MVNEIRQENTFNIMCLSILFSALLGHGGDDLLIHSQKNRNQIKMFATKILKQSLIS